MKAIELMKPRFELIADFPDNHYGKVGTILDRNWSKYPNDDESRKPIWKISDFPHLFRKLNWWEYRKESEMPKKVISRAFPDNPNEEPIIIEKWDMNGMHGFISVKERTICDLEAWNPEYGYFPID